MRVVVAPDKFKGSLSAPEAARAMARGVAAAVPAAAIDVAPMADGGEGTVEALVAATGGSFREAVVAGPLGEPVRARFGMLGDGHTAVLEMAAASGLALVPRDRRDPSRTSTRGTGELLLAAVEAGARRVLLGIGGSATNDGGAGLGQALGYRLLDAEGQEIGPGGGALDRLAAIDASGATRGSRASRWPSPATWTTRSAAPAAPPPSTGRRRAPTPRWSPRSTATSTTSPQVLERDLGVSVRDLPGAGAAGGLGAGLVAFASGRLEPGIALVIRAVGLADRLRDADLCLTGEGALDASSAFGKTPIGVARLARSLGCPTIALAGTIGEGAAAVLEQGIDAFFSICPGPITLDDALARGATLLEHASAQATRAFLAGRQQRRQPGV